MTGYASKSTISSPHRPTNTRRGFSLLELLTVIAIIAVLLAIIFPALGYVRRTVRVTDSRNLMTNLSAAVSRFQTDNRRLPGYFSAREMGSDKNLAAGFSSMQNAMLDLAGGVDNASKLPTVYNVGPSTVLAEQVKVNPALIGSSSGKFNAYFVPPIKNFIPQNGTIGGERVGTGDNLKLPELVDAFGMPILYWGADESTKTTVTTPDEFAIESRGSSGVPRNAKFYWAQNAAFLGTGAKSVGKARINQEEFSLLGQANPTRITSLAGMLGNPASALNLTPTTTDLSTVFPSDARGGFMIQSAGENGIYLSRLTTRLSGGPESDVPGVRGDGAGAKLAYAAKKPDQALFYGLNFFQPGSPASRFKDDRGGQTTVDLLSRFDDIVLSGG